MALERVLAKSGNERAVFELGHMTPKGCNHVYNPETKRFEQIFAISDTDEEGTWVQRVETAPGPYQTNTYEVDGSTIFARLLRTRTYKRR